MEEQKMENINKNKCSIKGTNLEGFKKAVKDISAITECRKIKSKDLSFFHFEDLTKDGRNVISDLSKISLKKRHQTMAGLKTDLLDQDALKENSTHLGAIITSPAGDEEVVFVSEYALPSLLQSVGLAGNSAFSFNNYYRNAFLASSFYTKKDDASLSLITRKSSENDEKVYYVGLSRYLYVPQDQLLIPVINRLADDKVLGTMKVVSWTVNHEISQIYLEFPDVAKEISEAYHLPHEAVPGLMLQTSDIGKSSFIAQSTLKLNGHMIRLETVSVAHNNKYGFNKDEYIGKFVEKIDNEIFTNVRSFPEKLFKLMQISISPKSLDSEKDREDNFVSISDILKTSIEKVFRKFSNGKKLAIFESLQEEIVSSVPYTAYDIAEIVISIPDRVQIDEVTATTVYKEIAKAPDVIKRVAKEYLKERTNGFI